MQPVSGSEQKGEKRGRMNSFPPHSHSGKPVPIVGEPAPYTPFAWGVGRRLGVAAVLIAGLWLAVAVALGWLGGGG